MGRRGAALSALGAGFLVIVAARVLVPSAPPLYDGVVPVEAYRWLDPPPPGQHGGAKGATATIAVQGGKSPLVAVATPELEPQAQILAQPGGLTLPAGAKTVKVSIQPVPAEGVPTDGHVDGNVYRIIVVDQDGTPITAPAAALVSVVLRAADHTLSEATVERYADGAWQPGKARAADAGPSFLAVATDFGDFAVVAPGPAPERLIKHRFDRIADRIHIGGRDTGSDPDSLRFKHAGRRRLRPSGLALARARRRRTRRHDPWVSRDAA